ncbi:MAG: hypothetical protein GWP08_14615 [Nitrospiraceae bacterium]|nr:hypothetical protein [Nitrospiraceae bacterium]
MLRRAGLGGLGAKNLKPPLLIAMAFVLLLGVTHAEVFALSGANWSGDANTQGGLDSGMPGDEAALVAAVDYAGYSVSATMDVGLAQSYAGNAYVEFAVGYRMNADQTSVGTVLWDGVPVVTCHATHSQEQLRVRKVVLSTAGFDFSAGIHTLSITASDTPAIDSDFFEVDAIQLTRIGEFRATPQAPWLIVSSGAESTPETASLAFLQSELGALTGAAVDIVAASALTPAQQQDNNLVLVGEYADHLLLQEILGGEGHSAPFSGDSDFVQEQGYVAGAFPGYYASSRTVYLAAGWDVLGSVYGISHLRTRLRSLENALYLDPEIGPGSALPYYEEFRPDFAERGVYYNIAYGISFDGLTPDTWNESEWEFWIDRSVLAQLTHIDFYIWGNVELDFTKSAMNPARNQQLRERLQHMIDYAHQRGLKVTYYISPTQVPQDIFNANVGSVPFFRSTSEYADHGFPVICQAETATLSANGYSWNGSMDLMQDVYGSQIGHFSAADCFNLWFYDPGGCWCGTDRHNCKGLQPQRMMEQVQAFTGLALLANPQAKMTVSMWPVRLLENPAYIGWAYGDAFLDLLKTYFQTGPGMDRVSVFDTENTGGTTLTAARAKGFQLDAFMFPTNVETAYPFLIPMLPYLQAATDRALNTLQAQSIRFMRIEEGSKYPMSYFISRFAWDQSLSRQDVVRQYAGWVANTNPVAAQELQEALELLDEFSYYGSGSQDLEAKGDQIRSLVESAVGRLDGSKQAELEFLLTTARVMALYGQAAEHPGDTTLRQQLQTEYQQLLADSASFSGFAPYATLARFQQHVDWLTTGWQNSSF